LLLPGLIHFNFLPFCDRQAAPEAIKLVRRRMGTALEVVACAMALAQLSVS